MTDLKVDIFLAGVSKSASTWLYHCFKDHPEISVPSDDSLRFFDLKYHKGFDWYESFYSKCKTTGKIVDPSPTYFRSPVAMKRISEAYPDAKLILSLRNPADRAFSQFWHEKKEGRIDFQFSECINRFLLYGWIIEHGFYATYLENTYRYFKPENIKVVLFDDLKDDAGSFYASICEFMGVDASHKPDVLAKRVNAAGVKANVSVKTLRTMSNIPVIRPFKRLLKKLFGLENAMRKASEKISNANEYNAGMSNEIRSELIEIYLPEIEKLENLTGMDLSRWKT